MRSSVIDAKVVWHEPACQSSLNDDDSIADWWWWWWMSTV